MGLDRCLKLAERGTPAREDGETSLAGTPCIAGQGSEESLPGCLLKPKTQRHCRLRAPHWAQAPAGSGVARATGKGTDSPNLSMVVIKSEGTKESRSASRMPRGSSWATWWPRIWRRGKGRGGAGTQLDRPSPRLRFWALVPQVPLQNFKFPHISSTQPLNSCLGGPTIATKVAGAQLCLKAQYAAFKNRKECIHKSSYYGTISNCKILKTSQMSINRRLANGYGKSTQGILQSC